MSDGARGRRVLLVDDSPFVCEALGGALRDAGFAVEIAHDLWDFERDLDPVPDLVLMDVVLQEAFGDDVAQMLRATRELASKIYLLSSLPDAELAQRTEDAGLDGYIAKRVGAAGIVARVREILGDPGKAPAAPAMAGREFRVNAHQRVRRVRLVADRAERWNAAAITAELHALVGDAELVGKRTLADAARTARDLVERQGSAGPTDEIRAAIDRVSQAAETDAGARPRTAELQRKLLVIDDSGFHRPALLGLLDDAGHVVVEARTVAEARQKLRAHEYDLVLVDHQLEGGAGRALIAEVGAQLQGVKIAILDADGSAVLPGEIVLSKQLATDELMARIARLLG